MKKFVVVTELNEKDCRENHITYGKEYELVDDNISQYPDMYRIICNEGDAIRIYKYRFSIPYTKNDNTLERIENLEKELQELKNNLQPKKEVLFVTEDKVEIMDGMKTYYISPISTISSIIQSENNGKGLGIKYFFYKENAIKYLEQRDRKPLFRTEDGVDIFEGGNYWFCSIKDPININYKENAALHFLNNDYIRFSTKEAAQKWLELQSPKEKILEIGKDGKNFGKIYIYKEKIILNTRIIPIYRIQKLIDSLTFNFNSIDNLICDIDEDARFINIGFFLFSINELKLIISTYNELNK